MAKESGNNVILKVGNGATPTEVFTALKGQKSAKLSINGKPIDVSDKTSDNWGATLAGTLDASIAISGFPDWPDTLGWDKLRTACLANQTVNLKLIVNASGAYFAGAFSITGFNLDGEINTGTGYDITLNAASPLTWATS